MYPGGIALVSRDGEEKILAVSRNLCKFYQCPSEEDFYAFTGGFYRGMVAPDGYMPLREVYDRYVWQEEDRHSGEKEENFRFFHFSMCTKEGHFRQLEGLLAPGEDPEFGKIWTLHLIRSRFREGELQTDPVTGLMGRYDFYMRALATAKEDRKKGVLGVHAPVYLNLTNFKLYNSNHGLAAGDRLLCRLASCLHHYFPNTLMAHLSADNFAMLARRDHLEETITALAKKFSDSIDDPSVALKAGITLYDHLPEESRKNPRQDFDKAKIAADSIKLDAGRCYAVYTEDMGRKLADEAYVLRNFEKALDKGYIRVYYQPVVRTLTGKLCNVEALARWEDPEKGLITPGRFIPVLEKARLIPKLDFYVIEEAARLLRFQMENERPLLPISVNLSRVDFDRADPVAYVENIVRKYQLPRSFFHIEITETALAMDGKKLQKEIRRFRQAGYECWLDDFGSGYSSLNVLQRFRFDEIKLDMSFQKHFNEESRKILRSLVLMAKNLGIHTLAEGVETKEQAEFLGSIGCEKIQGFYYAKPLPYEECHIYCHEKGLASESPAEAAAMEKAGLVNVMTDVPVSVFWYDGRRLAKGLWASPAFLDTVSEALGNGKKWNRKTVDLMSAPVYFQLRDLLDRALRTKKKETLTYVDNGRYMKMELRVLGGSMGNYTGKMKLYNITFDSSIRDTKRLDDISRHLLQVYDGLYLYHGKKDEIEVIESLYALGKSGERITRHEWMSLLEQVHPADRDRLQVWISPPALYREARDSGRSMAVGLFRILRNDGNYRWQEFDALPLGSGEEEILFCTKAAPMERIRNRKDVLPDFMASFGMEAAAAPAGGTVSWKTVLDTMKKSEEIKFFWKDRNRRFLGASRAFLDYYGIHDESTLLGKTDEDMGWHVDAEPFKTIEEEVIHKGFISRGALGKCIIRGRLHSIRASKVPLYEGTRIIGLMGYFEDLDEEQKIYDKDLDLGLVDRETGLTGFRGMLMAGLTYYDNYERKKEDFVGILLHIPEFDEVYRIYGNDVYQALLSKVCHLLSEYCPLGETLGYLGNGRFLIFKKFGDAANLKSRLLNLANDIHNIREIREQPVTLYLQRAVAYGSEAGRLDAFLRLLSERLDEAEQEKYGQSIYVGDRIAFDREAFDTSDQSVMMSDLDTYKLIYVNKAGLKDLGLPEDFNYHGMTCHKLLCGLDYPCDDCPRALLRRDRFYTRTYHNRNLGKDYLIQHTLVPWRGKNCHLEMATNLHRYMENEIKKNDVLFKEMAVNDAIAIGLQGDDPSRSIENMLARVGQILEAEKACIFEEMPDGTIKNTYEWCREGIPSTKGDLQKLPRKDAQPVYDHFDTNQIAIITDVGKVLHKYGRTKPRVKGLRSLISGHLVLNGRSLGFTEIVNPSESILKEASPLLATITRVLAVLLRHRDNVHRLNMMSYVDSMTGTRNRRAFLKQVGELPAGKETAFIFGDMNGLKSINDHFGHTAGDRAISTAAGIMKDLAGKDNVFRMGGDEFIMIVMDMDREKADDLICRLKKKFELSGISMAFGAAIHTTPIEDIDAIITEADGEMYRDKKHPRE